MEDFIIAVVDDDPGVLKAVSRLLRARAFRVHTYQSAQEFIASLPNGLPKCLIVDFQMLVMTGLELSRCLIEEGINIPTIIVTAHPDLGRGAREKDFAAALLKPLQATTLIAAVDRAIGMSRDKG